MRNIPWPKEFPGDITVCDADGVILEMNDHAVETFAGFGGRDLIGENLADCHPEPSRSKLNELLESGQLNAYIVEKDGKQKLIYQAPWYVDGQYRGLVELSLPLPDPLPRVVREES